MLVLVTGAAGFLGRQLVECLAASGYDVRAVDRCRAPEKWISNSRVGWIQRDLARESLSVEEVLGVDSVLHLAGATLGAGEDESVFLNANEATLVHLLRSCAGRINKFILASSQVVYGNVNHLAVTEEFPLEGIDSAYACSKINSENWLRWFQRKHRGHYVALRFCGFLEGGGAIEYMVERALCHEPIELHSNGRVCRDYLPVEKSNDAFLAALRIEEVHAFEAFNVGSGQIVTALEIAKMICAETGSRSAVVPIDRVASRANFVFDISKAVAKLGFHPGVLTDEIRAYAHKRLRSAAEDE